MKCYIRTIDRKTKEVLCYRTQYKNVVVTKITEERNPCYSVTHYPTGIALSKDRYKTKKEAFNNLDNIIKLARQKDIKQLCKKFGFDRINFKV